MDYRDRIIVALDVDSRDEAMGLVKQLRGRVGFFKIGTQLFTSEGPRLVREVVDTGERVFLDLKFHDIPNTVLKGVLAAQRLGVSMLTLHAAGGSQMLSTVARALCSRETKVNRPLALAVTVLTSIGEEELRLTGCLSPVHEQVLRLAELADQAGLDGVVASPAELSLLRQRFGNSLILVAPGIRPAGADVNDQNRIATPDAALRAGADYLVIGRPITASQDPRGSLERILEELDNNSELIPREPPK